MRDDARRTLIATTCPGDRRRAKLAKLILSYGDRIQYSVFIVDAAPRQGATHQRRGSGTHRSGRDSVLFCDLGLLARLDEPTFSYIGRAREVTESDALILSRVLLIR